MSLDNFKKQTITWDMINQAFEQPIQIMEGDVNARTLLLKITDNGSVLDLTGYSVKLTYKYVYKSQSGFIMLTPSDISKGEFTLIIPTEMTVSGLIKSNLILLNESLEQVIVSKNLTFISDNSTVTDLAQEVNNKIDDFTKLLLENMPQVMRSELNDLHAQTESNKNNIELKANLADMTSLQNAMTNLQNEVEAFGITPENLVTIKSLLDAIASNASESQVVELINSVNVLTSNISLMSNGDYSPKANQTDLESLQSIVNNQSSTISAKANQTDLNNLQDTVNSQGIAISTKAEQADLIAIDLKVKDLSDSKADKGIFLYGDLIFNIDEKKLILDSVYLNYDYGDGLAIPNSTIDLSSIDNKVVYFDVNNQSVKTDYYVNLGDGDIVIGYFNPEKPNTSFNNTTSRVLFIKNGVTYSPDFFKTQGSILSSVYMSTFGDSITSDQVSGTGTQIMNALGAKNGENFATGWSTASDWHNGDTNITTVTLTTPNNTDTNDNVLSNQIRRQLQYTTASGQQITWTHPIDGTFSLDTTIGTGLGNTDKIPSVIYIAISTNDGKNDSVPVVDDTDSVFAQNYKDLTRNSLASGLRWAIETLQSAYPNANIFIASPLQTDKNSGHMSFPDGNLKREIVKKVARFTSVNYIDSFSESGFSALKNKALTVDGIHPSDVGKKKLVDYVTNEIRKKTE